MGKVPDQNLLTHANCGKALPGAALFTAREVDMPFPSFPFCVFGAIAVVVLPLADVGAVVAGRDSDGARFCQE